MRALERAPMVEPADRDEWRAWLERNHATSSGVWLVTGRAGSGVPRLDYEASIEEALCFGWVDGQAGTLDERRAKLYFAPRRPGSAWARTNKDRVARLNAAGRMAPAGVAAVERAKADGGWTVFDSVDRLELPGELADELGARSGARANWDALPDGVKRQFLATIALAKRPETRSRRIQQVAQQAERVGRRRG